MTDKNQIVVFRNGRLDGPFSRPAVIAALKSGALHPDMSARTAGSQDLRPLREVIELTASQAAASAPHPGMPRTSSVASVPEAKRLPQTPTIASHSKPRNPLIPIIGGITLALVLLFSIIALLVRPGGQSEGAATPGYPSDDRNMVIAKSVTEAEKATLMVKCGGGVASAFVAKSEDGMFIYTAAHAAIGGEIAFFDFRGNKISAEKNPQVVVGNRGHDLVRFRLKQSFQTCLTFASREEIEAKPKVFALGDSAGEGVLMRLQGKVVGVGPDKIEVDCEFIPGNSGGPIVTEAGKVVGVVSYLTADPSIWARNTQLEVRRFAWIPNGEIDWKPCKASQLLEEADAIEALRSCYFVLAALEQITPGANGAQWDDDEKIMERFPIKQIFAYEKDHVLVRGLHSTGREAARQTSRGDSNAEVVRNYQRFFRSCVAFSTEQMNEADSRIISSFHRQTFASIKVELAEMIDQFNRQSEAFERNPQLGRSLSSFR